MLNMRLFQRSAVLSAVLLLCFAEVALSAPEQMDIADTRILIDVSGSMKKNDPKNLRRPALRLLVGLLPLDSRAGVWIFGRWVNMEIPLGKVDKSWKTRAMAGAEKIHSRGLFTNIEGVLQRSIADWEGASTKYQRHIVLLTDGMVDISKNPAENAASRQRILTELLPKIKEYGATLHAVALSERADHELLQSLATETNGWYEQVNEAAQLQRVFLRIFEKVARPDSVPLKDNRFQVDASIEEATLLVFRDEGAAPTKVVMPSGKEFSAKDLPEGVSWHRDEGYDLLTISKPEEGEWLIQAALDPDNRVMVVTDLKMQAPELPSRMLQGEHMPLQVHFTDQGERITNAEFLEVVNLKAEYSDSNGPGEARPIFDDGKKADQEAGDGIFTLMCGGKLPEGRVELVLTAEGKTFVREKRYSLEVLPAAKLESSETEKEGVAGVAVKVTVDSELVVTDSVQIEASLVSLTGESVAVPFSLNQDGTSWDGWVDSTAVVGEWNLGIEFSATTPAGKQLAMDLGPVTVAGSGEPPPPVEEPPEPAPEPEPEPAPEPEPIPEPLPEEPEEEGSMLWMILLGVTNALLIVGGGLGYWVIRRRAANDGTELAEDSEPERREVPQDDS
jgi:uncharacterized protein (TIGR03503 family)